MVKNSKPSRWAAKGGLTGGFGDGGARIEHGVIQSVEYCAARVFVVVAAVLKNAVNGESFSDFVQKFS